MKPSSSFGPFLRSLALGAGKILLKHFNRVHHIEKKKNAGIVTEVDKHAENYLLKNISRKFPQSSIITEESGEYSGDSLCWVIDPLDGTTNYAHGFPFFCVSIGVYYEGKPRAGVVYQPVFKELFFAEAGKGAYLNGKRIHVSSEADLSDALLGTGFYYSKGSPLKREMETFKRMNELARGVRRPGAAALDLAYVACGRYDGFYERGLSPWDVAAGFLLVMEAGGKISDYRGRKTTIHKKEVVASNGKLHPSIIRVIRGSSPR